jgi:hypothetical protein
MTIGSVLWGSYPGELVEDVMAVLLNHPEIGDCSTS